MRIPALTAVLPLLALLLSAGAPDVAAAPQGPRVALRTLDLSRVEGTLASLDEKSLTLAAAGTVAARSFPLEEVIQLAFEPRRAPAPKGPLFRAYLVGGERLVGRFAGPVEDGFQLDVDGLGTLPLLFEHVLTLESLPLDAGPCHDTASRYNRPETGDAAYDVKGDEYAGTVLLATKDELVLESARGRERRVRWNQLTLLHLENEKLPPAEGLRTEVELRGGSRLQVTKLGLVDKGLRVALRSVPERAWTAAFDTIQTVRWAGGRFDYASSLPYESERRPYHKDPPGLLDPAQLERYFGTRVDRRVSGCPLRVGGETFRHGFGVHSHSLITISLGERYASFRSSFGIDDEVLAMDAEGGRKGDVDARILGDGKVLWEAKGVRGGAKPRRIGPLDVRGVKTLVLEVGFGKELYTLDRADWGDPILVKVGEK